MLQTSHLYNCCEESNNEENNELKCEDCEEEENAFIDDDDKDDEKRCFEDNTVDSSTEHVYDIEYECHNDGYINYDDDRSDDSLSE